MIETCERCGVQSAKLEKCEYCAKKQCFSCTKSSRRRKVGHIFICKDCWGNIPKRTKFKNFVKEKY